MRYMNGEAAALMLKLYWHFNLQDSSHLGAHRDLAIVLRDFARLEATRAKRRRAIQLAREARDISETIALKQPKNMQWQREYEANQKFCEELEH